MASKLEIMAKKIGDDLIKKFRNELKKQGYFATGNLDNSFSKKVSSDSSGTTIEIQSLEYAKVINYGAKPFYPNIKEIERWVEAKGFSNSPREKKTIARRVADRIAAEGLPHPTYSKSGAPRKDFIGEVMKKQESRIKKQINTALGQEIEVIFKKIPKQV